MDFGPPNAEIGRKMANGQMLFLALVHVHACVRVCMYKHVCTACVCVCVCVCACMYMHTCAACVCARTYYHTYVEYKITVGHWPFPNNFTI